MGGCGAGSRLEKWLKADLAAHPSTCTLAYWHEPRWTSGPRHSDYQGVDAYVSDLYAAGADVILSSGNHNYERFAPQKLPETRDDAKGIVEYVVGTGGKNVDAFSGTPVPNSLFRNGDTFGVLALTLHPTGWDWKFVAEGGTVTDQGTAPCH